MKNIFLLCLLFSFDLLGQTLEDIIRSTKQNKTIQALRDAKDAKIAEIREEFSYAAPSLSLELASAKEGTQDSIEYALSFSQDLKSPFANGQKDAAQNVMIRSVNASLAYESNNLIRDLALAYHRVCVDLERLELLHTLIRDQNKVLKKLHTAYNLGEISRREFLSYRIENLKLQDQEHTLQSVYQTSLMQLQTLAQDTKLDSLSCRDLIAPTQKIEIDTKRQHTKLAALSYEKDASDLYHKVASSTFESMSYTLLYEKEPDKKRYGVLLSIPLTSLTSQKQERQAQFFHTKNKIKEELLALDFELNTQTQSLKTKLSLSYNSYKNKEEIALLSKELQELASMALLEGEGSVMESLEATLEYYNNSLQFLEIKREYYEQLFSLYKIIDKDIGEIK